MSKGYEERYLITLLSAVMNQKTAPEPIRQLDWEKLYRLADYHHVAHSVYYGIMGLEEEIPQSVRQRFFDKYLEAVHRTERLRSGETEICKLLERGRVNCFILSYADIAKGYPIEEMCCCESIEVGTDKKHVGLIGQLLQRVDFEERKTEGHGHIYYRVSGFSVFCYNHSLFFSRQMKKFYKRLISTLPCRKGCRYIREMSPDDKYLFLMCRLTDCFARGEISLNQIMDFWVFYKRYAEAFSWPFIYENLKKLKIANFAEKLEYLILRWFGTGAGIDNAEEYDAIETYILTKGSEGREISSRYLPLIKTVADCYARNRKLEKIKKLLKWMFPDKRYMETIYPVLGQAGVLIPIFWIMRLVRYVMRFIRHEIKEKIVTKLAARLQKDSEKVLDKEETWIENPINSDKEDEVEETTEIP